MIFLARLALRELLRSWRVLWPALVVLSLGLLGPVLTMTLSHSVDDYMNKRSHEIFSADFAIQGLRPLQADEQNLLERALSPVKVAREIEFVTMARGERAGLVQVRALSSRYPVLGRFRFVDGGEADSAAGLSPHSAAATGARGATAARDAHGSSEIKNLPRARLWASRDASAQLGLKVGDTVRLGSEDFLVEQIVDQAPGLSRFGGVAPALYIAEDEVLRTGLALIGSQLSYRTFYQLPPSISVAAARTRIAPLLTDNDLSLRTPEEATEGFERAFGFFKIYLATMALIVFSLAWVSAFYILQVHLQNRTRDAAIFLSFGASIRATWFYALAQIATLVFSALIIALAMARLLILVPLPKLGWLTIPDDFVLSFDFNALISMVLVAAVASVLFVLPLLQRLGELKLNELLSDSADSPPQQRSLKTRTVYLPLFFLVYAVAVLLLQSWLRALEVVGGLTFTMALAWMFSIGLFRVLRWSVPSTWPLARLVATALVRSRMGTRLCFLTLLLASLILNLVPHLLRSAEVALAPDTTKSRPDLFLFNIPESGLSDIEAFAKQQGAQLQYVSPLILGRLMRVNGVDTENDQFQRFPVRLTVRTEMLNSERLVEGPPLPNRASDQGPLPISMEKGFAERNGFRLGDTIDFDIQGVPVSGRVINFRQVDWKSFHPNFFMSFPHGLLDDAPKVWIANWTFSQSRPDGAEVQSKLTEKFPDVNVIAVGPALNKVLDLIRSVIGPVEAAAMIAAVLSLAIVMAVIAHNVSLRSTEIQIMRVFGAVPERVVTVLMSEYVGLALLATAAASLFGIACAGAVGWRVFQLHFPDELHFDFARAAISSAALVALIAFVAWRSVARSMRAKSSL